MRYEPQAGIVKLAVILLSALTSGSLALAAEIYTWKDANGVTHYSDVKPESDKVKVLKAGTQRDLPGTAPPAAGTKPDASAADAEAAFKKRRAEAAEAQAKADKELRETLARKETCEASRNQLTALKNGERMARYNNAGEKEVLDDAAREAEIARVQRSVDSACK